MVGRGVVLVAGVLATMVWIGRARAADPLSPAEMLNGPSMRETGKLAGLPMQTLGPAPGTFEPQPDRGDRAEKSVEKAAAEVDRPLPRRVGSINSATLQRETADQLAKLDDCRIDVARHQQVPPADVLADTLTLRWTIRTDGTVTATEVVATSPTDLEVMDCVKAAMSGWSFTHPRGGSLPVEREFRFRPVP